MSVQQAISQVQREQAIHNIAYMPLHRYFARMIPYLEQRQEVAKRLTDLSRRIGHEKTCAELEKVIEYCDSNIMQILNIQP